jgi:hypothetical protein
MSQAKHRLPLHAENSKRMSGLFKITQKLTGAILTGMCNALATPSGFHSRQHSSIQIDEGASCGYFLFRTLPFIGTGANLTCSLLWLLIQRKEFASAEHVHIQWDGAADNGTY